MGDPASISVRPSGGPKPSGPSLLACLSCRQKHLKCDGKMPICGRCTTSGSECQYTPSRRGYKGPSKRRRANPSSPDQTSADAPFDPVMDIPHDYGFQSGYGFPLPTTLPSSGSESAGNNFQMVPQPTMQPPVTVTTTPLTPDSIASLSGDGYLVDLFYTYFQPAHPILPPLRLLYRYSPPPYLEQVLKFIGAHYTPAASSEVYRSNVVSNVVDQGDTIEKVQALILLTVVLHSRNERAEAGECLAKAVDLAFRLGLNRKDFAETMSGGDPVREESLRRTWWELFFIEGMLTALGVRQSFTMSMVPLEVPLPCEEQIYRDGLCPPSPPTVSQFDDRVFVDEEVDFSSFAYRIEAIRILGRVVAIQELTEGQQDQVEAVDARIASWYHNLPESKTELMRPDGGVDEMMFQARMVVNGAAIFLHFPRSDLLSSPAVAASVICGHSGTVLVPTFSHHTHAMKAIKSASEISNLAATRLPVIRHTPFFICALVLSSIVQLAGYSVKAGQMPDPRRDRLTLTIGVFKSLGRTWAISQTIMRQIKVVARDILDIGLRPAAEQHELDFTAFLEGSQFWLQDAPAS
ncbi:transcriptional regulator family: Fungal Specific TF [Paecilomyces variotii]|nr:transcriptional regulator family: Fungal Specific TF [Paecilomyces variotii]KAJ9305245.1 transcriptional regulator family: Fungal Specific TF [Paecilomyces variotii]KAJ9315308.1 transcriptional regulator family: Fungal Specific TF [Paecilomyces variotii]